MTLSPPFLLDVRSTNGSPLGVVPDGDGGELRVHEWTSWLRVRSDITGFVAPTIEPEDDDVTGFVPPVFADDGLAVTVHLRDHQDLGGRAIGLFHARAELPELEAIREAVAAIAWAKLPRPIGGDFNAPDLSLRYASGELLINRGFNARSGNFIEAIAPLWALIDKLMTKTKRGPSGTIEPDLAVEIAEDDPRRCTIRFALRNRSIGQVALTDPRVPTGAGQPRLAIRIGERLVEREHASPFEWTTLELAPLPEDAPRSLLLNPRRRWTIELPWTAPKPGLYEVDARWLDYDGPLEPLPDQIPFMPVPSHGPAYLGAGPYPVRGSCSAARRFEIA